MSRLDPELARAFSAESFRELGHQVVNRLADYLAAATARAMPVLPFVAPEELSAKLRSTFEHPNPELWSREMPAWLAGAIHLHHPRYVGHQVTSPLPEAALCELIAGLTNNGAAVYEMGPLEVAMERALIELFAKLAGLPANADGVFTSGGSAGNLTALLAARQARAGFDVWQAGMQAGEPLGALVSAQAHYSVERSLEIAGFGKVALEPVPVDAAFRLRPEALSDAIRRLRARGRKPILLAASAGSTATGAYDPIEPIAEFCEREGLWLHVDGAHGACALLSERLRPLMAGVERADSLVWDAHKMMLMPALVTVVLFRDGARSYQAFAQEASYLFTGQDAPAEWFNLASRTLECTKRWMALPLYSALTRHGLDFFARYVDAQVERAAHFAEQIEQAPDFELCVRPQSNIVCFRFCGDGHLADSELDALQCRIRAEIVTSGAFYLVQTVLAGKTWLRTTIVNPLTSDNDLADLLRLIREIAGRIRAGHRDA